MFVRAYAGPVMAPSMWALVFALPRQLRRSAWGVAIIALAAVSTLGACLFSVWVFGLAMIHPAAADAHRDREGRRGHRRLA